MAGRNKRGWPTWMGSLKHIFLVGLATLILSAGALWLLRPADPLFWRWIDGIALVMGGAGVLVVISDARRSVASWQLEQIQDWVPRHLENLKRVTRSLILYSDEPAKKPRVGPVTERHEIWNRDRVVVHEWVTNLSDKLEQIKPEDLAPVRLEGDLAVPETEGTDFRQDIDFIVFWADHYHDARDEVVRLRAASRSDSDMNRAVMALAPFSLVIGLALALAAMLTKPLA